MNPLQPHSDFWQNLVHWTCRSDVPISFLIIGWEPLTAFRRDPHPFHMALSIFKPTSIRQIFLMLRISLTSPSATS